MKKNGLSYSEEKPNPALIIHFTYHKCMSVYFMRIFENISNKIGWDYRFFETNEHEQLVEVSNNKGNNKLLIKEHSQDDLSLLPHYLKGSHIIRDPRDLLVSGYKYHKWCDEPWANVPLKENMHYYLRLHKYNIQKDISTWSYRRLLNEVDRETGLKIELNFRSFSFQCMYEWNYHDPKIMELRYEEIFGNESPVFKELFKHYGFDDKQTRIGLKYMELFSFNNQKKIGQTGTEKHLSKGISGQWEEYFSDELKALFKKRHQDLLVKLDYADDDKW